MNKNGLGGGHEVHLRGRLSFCYSSLCACRMSDLDPSKLNRSFWDKGKFVI